MKKIILNEDCNFESQIFLDFLNNKEYPQHKNMIFFSFPELEKRLGCAPKEEEEKIVRDFLKETRSANSDNILNSINFIKEELEKKGEKTLEILSNLMNYKWKFQSEDYFLVPTILPISPFKNNVFYYSIFGALKGVTEYPKVLAVSAHEISHMILFDILKEKNEEIGTELLYFIKELIAPILVYQDDFSGVFNKQIVGNYNVLEIYFEENGQTIKAFDYFLEIFNQNRFEGRDFNSFLDKMISISKKIEKGIKEKRTFDNTYGIKIMKDPELLKEFRNPIKL